MIHFGSYWVFTGFPPAVRLGSAEDLTGFPLSLGVWLESERLWAALAVVWWAVLLPDWSVFMEELLSLQEA